MTWIALTFLLLPSAADQDSAPRSMYLWSEAGIILPRIEGHLYGTLDTGLDIGRMLVVVPFQEKAPSYLFAVLERGDLEEDAERDEFVDGFLGGYFRKHEDRSTTPLGIQTLGGHEFRLYSVQASLRGKPGNTRVAATYGEGQVVVVMEMGGAEEPAEVSQTMRSLLSGMQFEDSSLPASVKRLPVILYLLGAMLLAAGLAYLATYVTMRKTS